MADNMITINTEKLVEYGDNIQAIVQDDKMILVIDLKQPTHLSSTGKMNLVASSGGFTSLPKGWRGNIMIGKNVEK